MCNSLPSARRFFRARVSTWASYAPLRPLVVTESAIALRDVQHVRHQRALVVPVLDVHRDAKVPGRGAHARVRVAESALRTPAPVHAENSQRSQTASKQPSAAASPLSRPLQHVQKLFVKCLRHLKESKRLCISTGLSPARHLAAVVGQWGGIRTMSG